MKLLDLLMQRVETKREAEQTFRKPQRKFIVVVDNRRSVHLRPYLTSVISGVRTLMAENESDFVLYSQVSLLLKRNKMVLPVALGEFFKVYKSVFKTAKHPQTNALTVSLRTQYR